MPAASHRIYKRIYEGVNHRLRTFAGGRWAASCRPTSIGLLMTERCNARCVHCDIWKNRGREDPPSLEQWRTVLSDLRTWLGPVQVFFTGGEALLNPITTDLVGYGSSIGLFVEVLTHGYWLEHSRIEKLALASPWRITVSLDGIGDTHTRIRGRPQFFEKTTATVKALERLRREHRLDYSIRLKTVVMAQNIDEVGEIARWANRDGIEVFYQPIEQNYNTREDPRWFESSTNWPRDPEKAVAAVQRLIELKREGLPIANSYAQLQAMIPYFRDPDALRIATQAHMAHERRASCAALTMLQLQANGDVTICAGQGPVGNITRTPIRDIWRQRPSWWEAGCCLEWRCSEAEKRALAPCE
jgi:MoaA/NifB/PqqE/SkfB family radical SAM enzyme